MGKAGTVHRAMFDAVRDRDWDAMRELFHADYVYRGSDGAEHKGVEAAIEQATTYVEAFSDLSFEILHQFEPDDRHSIVEFVGHGTHDGDLMGIAPTGRHVDVPVCNVIELRDGLIVREREYYDTGAMMQQLGVS